MSTRSCDHHRAVKGGNESACPSPCGGRGASPLTFGTQAVTPTKRAAQTKLVKMILLPSKQVVEERASGK